MAFETLTQPTFKKATSLAVGESVEGFIYGFHHSEMYPDGVNFKMRGEDGKEFILSGSGNLKYFKKNNHPIGFYYKFTRLPDVKNKRGQTGTSFEIAVDKSKKCEVEVDVVQVAKDAFKDDGIKF